MSLHSERWDYAMGFSSRDPDAHTRSTAHVQEQQRKRQQYLNSLTETEREAYERVKLCLAALGQYFVVMNEAPSIMVPELHKQFPAFAKAMGWTGPLYIANDDKCPAISISYPTDSWFITPHLSYSFLPDGEQKKVHTEEFRQAALEFLKAWLPSWKWDGVTFES